MYKQGQQFFAGDGIVADGIEATIKNIGRLGREGMRATNDEIIDMMIKKQEVFLYKMDRILNFYPFYYIQIKYQD